MCGAIHTECIVEGCLALVKYDVLCTIHKRDKEYPSGA